jgi:hypothetical protein
MCNVIMVESTTEENVPLIALQAAFEEIHATPNSISRRMLDLGDYRSQTVIIRSLHRMLAGETRVSGEMLVIANLLVREFRQLLKQYADLKWQTLANGCMTTIAGEFRITLHPKPRGKWLVHLVYLKSGYSPPYPQWQPSLEVAQQKAIACLADALNEVEQLEKESLAA